MPSPILLRHVVRDLESDFDVKAFLDKYERTETGANWAIDCPVCLEKDGKEGKLHVLVETNERKEAGAWICFYCEESGSTIDLIQRLNDCEFFQAVEVLRKFSRFVDRELDVRAYVTKAFATMKAKPQEVEAVQEVALPEHFIAVHPNVQLPKYFRERGLTLVQAYKQGLGFCVEGRYKNRLVVPITRNNVVAGFQARYMRKQPPEGVKKYLNDDVGSASKTLYGSDKAKGSRKVILVEDVFSKLFIGKQALALRGTHLSATQFSLLASVGAEEVVICLDNDAAEKAEKIASQISGLWEVRIAQLPDSRDPDEYVGREEEFKRIIDQAPAFGSSASFLDRVKNRLFRR